MRIAMIGTGYVGLVSGACFSDFGHDVICIDTDTAKIAALQQGAIPIFEPGLDMLVARNVEAGRLSFSTDLGAAVRSADAVFLAVGTPSRRGDGFADLSFIYAAAEAVADQIAGFTVIATKSTVPVGTNDEIEAIFKQACGLMRTVAVVSNPEFLREGAAIEDFKRPDRVVVGARPTSAPRRMMREHLPPALSSTRRRSSSPAGVHRGADQVRRQCVPGVEDHLHQRGRRTSARRSGADVQQVARGIGLDGRIAQQVPERRARATAARVSRRTREALTCAPPATLRLAAVELVETTVIAVNDRAQSAPWPDKIVIKLFDGDLYGARPSGCSASPSSPTPTTCAKRPAW